MTSRADMEAALEAILFVASEPVSRERLLSIFDEGGREAAAEALEAVLDRYRSADEGRGLLVDEAAGGIRLATRPELHGYLRRFFEISGKNKLSMAALETLAIVAYRQPVTAPEIQELRGVSSTGVLKTLLDRRLVRIAGRKEVVGKPFLYTTTKEFLLHFGLQSIKDLPPLEEFEDALSAEGASLTLEGPDRDEEVFKQAALLAELEDDVEEEVVDEAGEPANGAQVGTAAEGEETVGVDVDPWEGTAGADVAAAPTDVSVAAPFAPVVDDEEAPPVDSLPAAGQTTAMELDGTEASSVHGQAAEPEKQPGLVAPRTMVGVQSAEESDPPAAAGVVDGREETAALLGDLDVSPGGEDERANASSSDAETPADDRDQDAGASTRAVTAGAPDEQTGS